MFWGVAHRLPPSIPPFQGYLLQLVERSRNREPLRQEKTNGARILNVQQLTHDLWVTIALKRGGRLDFSVGWVEPRNREPFASK
jgi:hypothetical protein